MSTKTTTQPHLTLYDHPVSSYCQKLRIALREKTLDFTSVVPAGLGSGASDDDADADFAAANPRREVPCLLVGDAPTAFKIFDSSVILAYLEDRFPRPALLPPDAEARAKARMIEEVCDTVYEAGNWVRGEVEWFGRGEAQGVSAALKAGVGKQTESLLGWLTEQLGPSSDYFAGAHFGYADCCVAPFLNRSVVYGLGPAAGSPLQRWHARIKERSSVAKTFAEMEEGVKKMASGGRELITRGGWRREYRDHRLEAMVKLGGIDVVVDGMKRDDVRFGWPEIR